MFDLACELLGQAGYRHYEVSNWASAPEFECRHNLGYWRKQPYLGLGAGAHSYHHGRRWWNVRPPGEYLDMVEHGLRPVGGEERLTQEDERLEEIFLKLRILEGVPVTSVADDVASGFMEQGLLRRVDGHLVPTERGMLLLNELVLGLAS
jgi:oxygen-independent coproporphyrinogen-3 oxidase